MAASSVDLPTSFQRHLRAETSPSTPSRPTWRPSSNSTPSSTPALTEELRRLLATCAGRDQAIAAALDELVQAAANLPPQRPTEGPSGTLVARNRRARSEGPGRRAAGGRCPGVLVVEMMGLEPTTPCLQSRCSSS